MPGTGRQADDRRIADGIRRWLDGCTDDPRLVHLEQLPARAPMAAGLDRPLPPAVARCVPAGGLWAHQAAAIDLLRAGRSVVLATPTASGKSLAFQLPVAESATRPVRPGTSLMVFPTKALAHDQLRSLTQLGVDGLVAAAYDGDSSQLERTWVRSNAHVILTNPEMIHHGMLPNHRKWATFLMRLDYVVIDELHVLRGVFGSHVGHLLRRLVRLCHHYGSDPTFVFTSATIGEPARLASELCGHAVVPITDDASPAGPKVVALWDPNPAPPPSVDAGTAPAPVVDHGASRSRSTNGEAAQVARSLIEAGLRTLVFCRSRRGTELVANDLKRLLAPEQAERICAYRSGYLGSERREIEDALFAGRLDGVVATNALELGVDIGGLDAVVLVGFPGTVASMWQQIGRAGRGGGPSLAVMIAGDDQLDQWVIGHPAETFRRPPERAVTNPANPLILDAHLGCAAHELPLTHVDERYWPDLLDDGVRRGVVDDHLGVRRRGPGDPMAIWSGRGWPTRAISLRSPSTGEFTIRDTEGDPVGTVDDARIFEVAHPGAIYLHQGRSWRVVELDLDDRTAIVERDEGDCYTQARSSSAIRILDVDRSRGVGRARLSLGRIEVTHQVSGYQLKRVRDHQVIGHELLDLPATQLTTRAFWYTLPDELIDAAGVGPSELGGSLHAVEHAAIGILPLFAICDRWDVGGLSTPSLVDPSTGGPGAVGEPTIVIYDGYAGGAGIAELGWDAADRHLSATLGVIERCRCSGGCPSCVQSPKCGNWNEPLDKAGASRLLRTLLHR